jgi:hypothetical protein
VTHIKPVGHRGRIQTTPSEVPKFDNVDRNSHFLGKYIYKNNNNICFIPFKLRGTADIGLPPSDPRSLCTLSSIEFVEINTPPKKIMDPSLHCTKLNISTLP